MGRPQMALDRPLYPLSCFASLGFVVDPTTRGPSVSSQRANGPNRVSNEHLCVNSFCSHTSLPLPSSAFCGLLAMGMQSPHPCVGELSPPRNARRACRPDSQADLRDSRVILPPSQIAASTLPGASPGAFFDGGKTLVHEMGPGPFLLKRGSSPVLSRELRDGSQPATQIQASGLRFPSPRGREVFASRACPASGRICPQGLKTWLGRP